MVITIEQAKARGVTKGQISNCMDWNNRMLHSSKDKRDCDRYHFNLIALAKVFHAL